VRFRTLALVSAACLAAACGAAETSDPADPPAAGSSVETVPARSEEAPAKRPRGRPLPAFSGYTLDDRKIEGSDLIGKRLLLYFFNPEVKATEPITRALNAIAPLRGRHNFEIVGVAVGAPRESALAYVKAAAIPYPVIDDSSARLARRFGLQAPMAMLGTDAEGYVTFGLLSFPDDEQAIESNLRRALRLPETRTEAALDSGRPKAPLFEARRMDGGEPFELASLRGKPTVLIFFLHTCPHCHASLRFLRKTIEELPEDRRPTLVGIEISGKTFSVRQELAREGLDFFPVLFDDDGSIQKAYGVFAGVPDIFLIDAEGRIVARTQGWSPERHEPLMRMRLAKLVGAPVPMLLRTNGYSGSEVCGVCHELEHETWTFTTHARAYDTLVRHGAENDGECVSCHVVGYGQPGGFQDALQSPDLENVGCESCHGRGGPHLSPTFVADGGYPAVCVGCHDQKHSLGFDYTTFRPRISHTENAYLLALPAEEKRKLLTARGRPGGDLLPTNAEYVGSQACQACHEAEYETWAASPHAHAVETLVKKGKSSDVGCLRCHTTAFDRPGGFPPAGDLDAHGDLARVGCESCHGPGGEHVREGAAKLGSIVSLGDKCDSCVILQICGSCHDEANDPGFEFEVQQKIDRQRHGTIEAGTGRPKGPTARRDRSGAEPPQAGFAPRDAEDLHRAFAWHDARR
jgi:peroxiredoxin